MAGNIRPRKIALIDGHPDPDRARFCHALAGAYAEAAESAGHTVRRITIAEIEFPILRSAQTWETGDPTPEIRQCQEAIGWADHLVLIYPLWLGSMPALTKGFLEQVFRPGFAIARERMRPWPGLLTGKSARIIVTMGMPAWLYRWFFLAHSLKSLERNILRFSGIKPVREMLIGGIEAGGAPARTRWLAAVRDLGRTGN
jgi:putative NADPH-quinone reductase